VILEQVTNGVAVRMAVLYLLSRPDEPLPAPEPAPRRAVEGAKR
jgi:hypothetical protein